MQTPQKVTDDDAIYLVDNGECLCGEHLGSSAMYTGRDISGQPIHRVTPEDARYMMSHYERVPACERCGREASVLVH